ncbi:hypothetical protein HN587_01985 [Candidatus Woesearchaeota archaeon]|jgi:hypothetical protein|nr:hypothetical protein [Candidatus Woesearchaeota archaeon]
MTHPRIETLVMQAEMQAEHRKTDIDLGHYTEEMFPSVFSYYLWEELITQTERLFDLPNFSINVSNKHERISRISFWDWDRITRESEKDFVAGKPVKVDDAIPEDKFLDYALAVLTMPLPRTKVDLNTPAEQGDLVLLLSHPELTISSSSFDFDNKDSDLRKVFGNLGVLATKKKRWAHLDDDLQEYTCQVTLPHNVDSAKLKLQYLAPVTPKQSEGTKIRIGDKVKFKGHTFKTPRPDPDSFQGEFNDEFDSDYEDLTEAYEEKAGVGRKRGGHRRPPIHRSQPQIQTTPSELEKGHHYLVIGSDSKGAYVQASTRIVYVELERLEKQPGIYEPNADENIKLREIVKDCVRTVLHQTGLMRKYETLRQVMIREAKKGASLQDINQVIKKAGANPEEVIKCCEVLTYVNR